MHKMAYQISSTRTERSGTRAFTLVEVMVAAGIGSFILAGVVSTFLMIGRTAANTANYFDLESNARQGLEVFGREVRNASNVTAFSTTSVTLTIPDTTSSTTTTLYSVTYSLAADPAFTGQNALKRHGPPLSDPAGTVGDTYPIHYVQPSSTVIFKYFSLQAGYINGPGYGPGNSAPTNEIDPASLNYAGIKQIELTLTAQRSSSTVVNATNTVLSACFTLRNK
jgi:type II secretory pathway pseudopilin PulG